MMRWVKYAVVLVGLTTLFYYVQGYLYQRKTGPKEPKNEEQLDEVIDYRASFSIYTNGILRNFSSPKYHNLSDGVYITSEKPSVIIVEKVSTWGDFFDTLPMDLTKDCLETGDGEEFCSEGEDELKFYLNGKRYDDLLYEEIKDGDRALITFGNETEKEIQIQIFSVPNPKGLF